MSDAGERCDTALFALLPASDRIRDGAAREGAAERRPCRYLRSRATYAHESDVRVWETIGAGVIACWCLRTMEPVGPDGAVVDPDACHAGRRCHVPPA